MNHSIAGHGYGQPVRLTQDTRSVGANALPRVSESVRIPCARRGRPTREGRIALCYFSSPPQRMPAVRSRPGRNTPPASAFSRRYRPEAVLQLRQSEIGGRFASI